MAVGGQVAPGEVVSGYAVGALVGRGGMGEVYRAHDARLDRPVALKVLAETFSHDEAFRDRLLRESRLAAGLDHPNVIPIYEAGEAAGRLFIAMRYVDGADLKQLVRQEGPLEPARLADLAAQVAAALDAAHARGLVHRDVKPSNVLVDRQGGREHAYLADFGLTQSVSDRRPTDGHLMGSVDYVAPEQIRGDEVDGRADVYALGCLLFEGLTGTLPFAGGSDVAVVFAHLDEAPPAASSRNPELPTALDEGLQRAMAKDPAHRPASCGELVGEAREALGLTRSAPTVGRRALLVALTAVVAVGVAAAIGATLLVGGGASPEASAGALVRIDPATNEVTATHAVTAHPGVVTATSTRVWLGDFRDGSLWRFDPDRGDLKRFTTTGEPRDLTSVGDHIYVAGDGETLFDGTVTRYDAVTGAREGGVNLVACSVAGGDGVLWVAGCPMIQRLSTDGDAPLRILSAHPIPFQEPRSAETHRFAMRDMAVGEGALWIVGDPVDRRVFRVADRSGEILGITKLAFAPRSISAGAGAVWVTGPVDDVVARLDPTTGRVVATIDLARGASGVATGEGAVWVASALDRVVSRIDPRTNEVVAVIPIDGAPREVAVGAGAIWVTTDAG